MARPKADEADQGAAVSRKRASGTAAAGPASLAAPEVDALYQDIRQRL